MMEAAHLYSVLKLLLSARGGYIYGPSGLVFDFT